MKKILVPTDFSENADAAVRAALLIAEQFDNMVIHLVHISSSHLISSSVNRADKIQKQNILDKLVETIKRNHLSFNDSLIPKVINGNPIEMICKYAESENIDLIVMGTQGATGLKEIFWGSNTAGVTKQSTVPVLAVPEDFVLRPFKEIVYAVDSNNASSFEVVNPLMVLARVFNSHINVFHLETRKKIVGVDPGVDPGIDTYFSDVNHSFHQVAKKGNISDNINTFTQNRNADMLCVIRREHSFMEGFYHTSTSRQSVLHSPVPILVLIDGKVDY